MLVAAVSVVFCLMASILAAPIPQPVAELKGVKPLVSSWRERAPAAEPGTDWRRNAEDDTPDIHINLSHWRARNAEVQERAEKREAEPQNKPSWRREAEPQNKPSWRREADAEPQNKASWRVRALDSSENAKRDPQYNYPPHWRTGP